MWKGWSRGDKLAAVGLVLTAVAVIAAVVVVPEFRRWFHLDKPETAQAVTAAAQQTTSPQSTSSGQNAEPTRPEPAKPKEPKQLGPSQKTTTQVSGNDNVAGNNISGDKNVTGNNDQLGLSAYAPNGIAITGGTVNNPTVNNVAALPDLTMSDVQEKQVADSLSQTFAGADVSIMTVQPNQTIRDFSARLARIFKSSGANVELGESQMYIPPARMTLHKGMSITSCPPEEKDAVSRFVDALGKAGVIREGPIYDRADKKINIVVNRSADTREEAKQY